MFIKNKSNSKPKVSDSINDSENDKSESFENDAENKHSESKKSTNSQYGKKYVNEWVTGRFTGSGKQKKKNKKTGKSYQQYYVEITGENNDPHRLYGVDLDEKFQGISIGTEVSVKSTGFHNVSIPITKTVNGQKVTTKKQCKKQIYLVKCQ